jgi:hypothetical protein
LRGIAALSGRLASPPAGAKVVPQPGQHLPCPGRIHSHDNSFTVIRANLRFTAMMTRHTKIKS